MKNRTYTLTSFAVIILLSFQACKKEAKLIAENKNYGYTLPQGTHDYDSKILEIYNKYNTYLLYEFTGKDTYWTPTGYKNSIPLPNIPGYWDTGYEVEKADPTYVGNQVDLIQKLWFRFYPDKFLKQFLPLKIMLCSKVDSVYSDFKFDPVTNINWVKTAVSVDAWYNYDNICIGKGNASVTGMLKNDSVAFAKKVNQIFLESILLKGLIAPTNDFISITNYTNNYADQTEAYANGILTEYYSANPQNDWNSYVIAMVTCTEATLNRSADNTVLSLDGILNSAKDSSGRIRERYNIVRNYFINTYGIDLQSIGNYTGQ